MGLRINSVVCDAYNLKRVWEYEKVWEEKGSLTENLNCGHTCVWVVGIIYFEESPSNVHQVYPFNIEFHCKISNAWRGYCLFCLYQHQKLHQNSKNFISWHRQGLSSAENRGFLLTLNGPEHWNNDPLALLCSLFWGYSHLLTWICCFTNHKSAKRKETSRVCHWVLPK